MTMITFMNGVRHLLPTSLFIWCFMNMLLVMSNNFSKGCIQSERHALLNFKKEIEYDYNLLSSWTTGRGDCCRWRGVRCGNQTGHVVKLHLRGDNSAGVRLFGKISSSLLDLPFLSHLDLSDNYFEDFPSFIGSLTNLIYLNLSHNIIEGTIPDQIGNISMLQSLDLSWNLLEGPVPSSFGDMVSLVYLDLSHNQLEGGIPTSFQNLCRLNSLDLSYNYLSEPLPYILQNLRGSKNSLKILKLSSNNLTGSVPDITDFIGLEILYAADNKLVGAFPEFSMFPSLVGLRLANNELNGTLGESLGKLSNLTVLDVSGNQLKGSLSEVHFSNLHKLRELDLSYNSLAVDGSSDWVPCFHLDVIKLRSCNLGPQFPHWIQSQKNFSHLDISNSNISDNIPNWFWNLPPTLRYLNLSFNNIGGEVPNRSYDFYTFPAVDFSSNLFYGPIPQFLFNTTVLNLSRNMFSGTLSLLCTLRDAALNYLDLSYNHLFGGLTDCWEQLKEMVILNLESNNFSGRIPSSLGSLSGLQTMSLRNNSLIGELPSTWKSGFQLELLNLGENRLTGTISSLFGQSLTRLKVLRLRSNEFYGHIPSKLCDLNSIQIVDLAFNNLSGSIPTCLCNLTAMAQNQTSLSNEISHTYCSSYDILGNGRFKSITVCSDYYIDTLWVVWRGYEQQYGKTLGLVKLIDLSSNHLIGGIPREVTSLLGIKSLNLSGNNLSGTIPGDIGQLKALESLDLSSNKLSGSIPSSLADITFLAKLDLSNNGLTGRIPTSTQLQSFDALAYQGNPGLCGPPLPNDCETIQAEYPPSNGKDGERHYWEWLLSGILVGFPVGFWGICVPLIISSSWRHNFFQFLENASAFLYFKIVRKLVKLVSKTTTT